MGTAHFLVCPSKRSILSLGELVEHDARLRFRGTPPRAGEVMAADEFAELISLFMFLHQGEHMFLASDKHAGPWDEDIEPCTWYELSEELRSRVKEMDES